MWRRFLSRLGIGSRPGRPAVRIERFVSIKTSDADGRQHEYHSLEEAPPEVRAQLEEVETQGKVISSSSSRSTSPDGWTTSITREKTLFLYKVQDAAGNERIYHSLDEMPPEIRAAFEQTETQTKMTGQKTVSTFKVQDAAGNERIYHSLDEMPAEIRAAFEQAANQAKQGEAS